ncbi:PREDICTED: uncharacterized protein LOC103339496 [Prunus mume]|uniref:Uncharacterized protein LOC103339496 n=1 Tax=Prunus mume TaxID=102107 RepID=A0ABM1LVU7_PRUMU|nr:PREDICTED: uncharacterized protein LOC103339496 [Prunus mume]
MVDIDDLDDDDMIEGASNADHPINPDVQAQQITNEDLHEQIKHFSHQHLLTLISGHHECDICNTFSQGFVYNCKQCSFNLDLQYNFLPDSLKHEAHDHCLILNRGSMHCVGCGCRPDFSFSCTYLGSCVFSIYCIKCVKLPLIARHKYDNHPLKLTDASVIDDDEYYCEICEGERDPEYWFYSCEDCDFDFHPDCVLGRYPQIKLGSTYKHDAHPHPVTFIDKIKSVIPNDKRYKDISPCEVCHEPCEGLVYECSECNINIHRNGCCN